MELANILYLSDSETQEIGDFRELKSKTFTGGACPWTSKKLAPSALVKEIGQYLF